ncbi:hypothetical protein RUM4293_00655 [Ruegeria atlantica]|uniref:Uncharacterized protein n=1 Tax=Ruegeria atlantica TaxID=81569 RepID=A0A0P1E493_9RHOB|nr:hypothetical protein RUM4293_00655 [Ruegeria atlantica]
MMSWRISVPRIARIRCRSKGALHPLRFARLPREIFSQMKRIRSVMCGLDPVLTEVSGRQAVRGAESTGKAGL